MYTSAAEKRGPTGLLHQRGYDVENAVECEAHRSANTASGRAVRRQRTEGQNATDIWIT